MDSANEISVIDVGDILDDPTQAALERVAGRILQACTSIGFFYLTNHGVPQSLVDDCFAANRRFHARPLEEKLAIKLNKWHRGYQPMATSTLKSSARFEPARYPNQLESFFLRQEVPPGHPDFERKPMQGPNQWPDDPAFRATVQRYDEATRALGLKLLPAFSIAAGEAPDFFTRRFAPPASCLRLLHYPPGPATRPDELYGIHPHTDYGFLTILAQDDVGGLQIQRVDGGWIDAPAIPGTFILNVGDVLARWTNDRFNSTPHRVVCMTGGQDRYSIGMFFDPNLETEVGTLRRFADAGAKYQPIRYGDYFQMRLDANYPDRVGVAQAS